MSLSSAGAAGDGHSDPTPRLSRDGRWVVFASDATNLVAGDMNGVRDVFLRDRSAGTTVRISTSAAGAEGNALSSGDLVGPSISDDGRYVGFYSEATNLVAGDTNGRGDAFVKDVVTGAVFRVSVQSDGTQYSSRAGAAQVDGPGRLALFRIDGGPDDGAYITPIR